MTLPPVVMPVGADEHENGREESAFSTVSPASTSSDVSRPGSPEHPPLYNESMANVSTGDVSVSASASALVRRTSLVPASIYPTPSPVNGQSSSELTTSNQPVSNQSAANSSIGTHSDGPPSFDSVAQEREKSKPEIEQDTLTENENFTEEIDKSMDKSTGELGTDKDGTMHYCYIPVATGRYDVPYSYRCEEAPLVNGTPQIPSMPVPLPPGMPPPMICAMPSGIPPPQVVPQVLQQPSNLPPNPPNSFPNHPPNGFPSQPPNGFPNQQWSGYPGMNPGYPPMYPPMQYPMGGYPYGMPGFRPPWLNNQTNGQSNQPDGQPKKSNRQTEKGGNSNNSSQKRRTAPSSEGDSSLADDENTLEEIDRNGTMSPPIKNEAEMHALGAVSLENALALSNLKNCPLDPIVTSKEQSKSSQIPIREVKRCVSSKVVANIPPKPHLCNLKDTWGRSCRQKFSRPYDLLRHQATVHGAGGGRLFNCILCLSEQPKRFSRHDSLARHIRRMHQMEPSAVRQLVDQEIQRDRMRAFMDGNGETFPSVQSNSEVHTPSTADRTASDTEESSNKSAQNKRRKFVTDEIVADKEQAGREAAARLVIRAAVAKEEEAAKADREAEMNFDTESESDEIERVPGPEVAITPVVGQSMIPPPVVPISNAS